MTAIPNWLTNGLMTNPVLGQVLADTGQLALGTYRFWVVITSTVAGIITVQWRTAANDANVAAMDVTLAGNQPISVPIDMITDIANERLRVVAPAVLGIVGATIMRSA